MNKIFVWEKLAIISLCLFLLGFSNSGYDGEGTVVMTPKEAVSLEKGEYRMDFIVGEHGINVGGGIKTRFPVRWIAQIKNPAKSNFLKVNLSREGSACKVTVNNNDSFLDGKRKRKAFIITVAIYGKPMVEGDMISLILSVTQPESMHIPRDLHLAFTEMLPVASDVDGDGKFAFIKDFPSFTRRPADPHEIHVIAPTIQQAGKGFDLKIAVLDKYYNAAEDYRGTVEFVCSDKRAKLPDPYVFSKEDYGIKRIPLVLNTPGYHTVRVYDRNKNWIGESNPVLCQKASLKKKSGSGGATFTLIVK